MRSGPPGFLIKTYRIVDDPNTNSVVKWGKFGQSFVISDHIKFSFEILPKYFNHNKFSSFVCQLNNYGFRKIGVEHKWEYMSPDFQQGKEHLLSNMRRRSDQYLKANNQRRNKRNPNPEMVVEDINEVRIEMNKLKMQHVDMDFHIMEIKQEDKKAAEASEKVMELWAKTCEVIAKRGREVDCDGVSKIKKMVEYEVQAISSLDDQAFKSKSKNIHRSSNDIKIWEKILLGEDEEGAVEVIQID